MRSNISRILYRILALFYYFVGWVLNFLPNKSKRIIFSQTNGRYSGNSRYLFEYLSDEGRDVRWLYDSKAQLLKIPDEYRLNAIPRNSLSSFFYAIRAEIVVISYAGSDFGILWNAFCHKYVLGLWHAITVKQIALLDEKFTDRMVRKYLRRETSKYDAQICSSDIDRYVTAASHGIDVRKVYVTGLPKADRYMKMMSSKYIDLDDKKFEILYAPTFRDYDNLRDLFFPFGDFKKKELLSFFDLRPDIRIYLRPHPSDLKSNIQAKDLEKTFPDNIVYYSQKVCDDIDEMLHIFDAIITDYSSIYLEPLLGDVPCIFVPYDLDKYIETRGLAYDYDMVTPGPKVYSLDELMRAILEAENGAPKFREKRALVKDMFFKYKDDGACNRIARQVLGLSNMDKMKLTK